jgi:Cof subfamily protein (haloacid dehalogenase superfamily)
LGKKERNFIMYKIIAIDIDDTLLNDEHEVSPGTRAAIAEAAAQGTLVTLATGRMYASARKLAKQIELNVPLITYQGALVKNLMDDKVWYERFVPQGAALLIDEYARANGLHLQLYWDDRLFAREINDKVNSYSKLSKIPYEVEPDFAKLLNQPLPKMLLIDEPAKLDEIAPELREMVGADVHMTKSKPNFLEFMHAQGTKGCALQHLAAALDCDMAEVIAIGDSWNDREMLEVAGLGVAMGNSVPQLKEIADYVTLSNNEDGIKHVIDKFVFGRT